MITVKARLKNLFYNEKRNIMLLCEFDSEFTNSWDSKQNVTSFHYCTTENLNIIDYEFNKEVEIEGLPVFEDGVLTTFNIKKMV